MHDPQTTTDHATIKQWAQRRDAQPARIAATEGEPNPGMLRFAFPGASSNGQLQDISWEAFFETFEAAKLELVFEERSHDGLLSQNYRFVPRARPTSDSDVDHQVMYE